MKFRSILIILITLLLVTQACSFAVAPAEENPALPETEDITSPETEQVPPTETEVLPPSEDDTPAEPTPTEPFACSPEMTTATAFTVEFCYPGAYSSGYSPVRIPESPPSDETPLWGVHPEMIEISLSGFPDNNRYQDPTVFIYPVADFIALDPSLQTLVDDLKALLSSQDPNPESIPFVPRFNAAQMMQANVAYFNFQNGRGVRFITQYGQAFMPISNDSTFYAFIGLTDDDAYLISATLPITHPLFAEDSMTEPAEGWEAFSENFIVYVGLLETELTTQPGDSFFPLLASLDEMMASFLIPPNAIP